MFTGKYSALKGFSLLLMIGIVVLDLIAHCNVMGAAIHGEVISPKWFIVFPWINFLVAVAIVGMIVYDLWRKWHKEEKEKGY